MNPFRYFLGRAMQIVGLGIITFVVIKFFTPVGMEPLLYYSVAGAVIFYGGTMILGKGES
ncbi:hypothetical protein [Nitrospina watsonii]|uniref:Uncharacterized protein n=1 Tax=Nitrospina watsonii TaxID=1323948 RepID=A0ABM9HFY2_9BACT|nr:hypothetical protein [Nitrospina watsonii]CAI2718943.1 conserved protein of unknown function [Nitrospina watsonii]